ncbi:Cytochrome P450 [Beauveria brongniartii RCEF 3172]|uniref:Cytochrome P450 n=1 Tax=Beauveria brongniartii RCEF 3172 TaxID=1081107 RepID=A0A167D2K6_9HYPO|nr:Cytochrome P450 [Beauveria brongniartii RCEF 3172]
MYRDMLILTAISYQKNDYVNLIESIGPMGALRSAFPWMASLAFTLPVPVFKSVADASKRIRHYAQESLSRYYKLASSDAYDSHHTLFTKLRQSEQNGEISFEEICANAQGYILAGSDTTASTLTYLIWSVCRRPDIKEELVEQLKTLPPDFDDDSLRSMPILGNVIDETLRLYPAAPSGLPRETPPEGANIAGYRVDGGTVLCAQPYSMHRDPVVFPNPEHFDPHRWQTPTRVMIDAFMPFGKGPRGEW